jgi:hypothetical protein
MIVGITGRIGSGKDTIADYLITFHGFRKLSFASSLKDAVAAIFGWDRVMLEGATQASREWREQVDPWWAERLGMPNLTPRWVLQYWGTEVCRQNFHNDIWVASLENNLRQTKDNLVITDCRFPNELDAIKNANGITIRVERGRKPSWYETALEFQKGVRHFGWAMARDRLEKGGIHASEYSSVGLDYDFVIDNNGTIEQLHDKIKSVVNR